MRHDLERSGVLTEREDNEILVDPETGTGELQPAIQALATIAAAGECPAP